MQVIHLIIIGSILLIIEIYFLFFKPNLKKHSIFAIITTLIVFSITSILLNKHIKHEKWEQRYNEAVEELNSNS